jgi:hypothetical protein
LFSFVLFWKEVESNRYFFCDDHRARETPKTVFFFSSTMPAPVLNLTPHDVNVGGVIFHPTDPANPARLVASSDPSPRPDKAAEIGVPVVEPYEYDQFAGLPRRELQQHAGYAVIVSQIAADWLRDAGEARQKELLGVGNSVYVPDTDRGAVRDKGRIVGTTRLVFQFESPAY